MDFSKIERKWQKKWAQAKLFEVEPDKRKKFFTSLIIAYPSGDLHIGHARTYSRTDILARFKRMLGYNTLSPMGFHATGNRAVVLSKRIKEKDPTTLKTLKELYKLSVSEIKQLEDPKKLVLFFADRCQETLNKGGFSIDWRRKFVTTKANPHFSKFIEWQFRTLRKKGYVSKGSHPVIYCPNCESPITQADRESGEEAIVQEFSVWKFPMEDGTILPAATLRPETIFAITNMFINQDAEYVIARVGEEKWILGKAAAEKLKRQRPDVLIIDEVIPDELIGRTFSNPVTGEKGLLVLPGIFVDPGHSTGVVVSEPSDAPDDHIALEELKRNESLLKRFNLTKKDIEKIRYKPLIKLEGYGPCPAIDICKRMNITSLEDPKLVDAKKEIYKLEFHQGKITSFAKEIQGKSIPDAIEYMKKKYASKLDKIYEPSERVVCKCGTECFIKLLENQWFLKYGDSKWKARVKKYMDSIPIYPPIWRARFNAALDWTDNKACARRSGLGTPLPWDPSWVIETLSDSTIYMAFYIITKFIKSNKIKASQFTDSFFDYVLLGKGNINKVSKETKLSKKLLNQIKSDFDYWYPVDWRNSAKDLVSNHLLYYLYNHIAIFPKNKWPKVISVNGYVKLEGEKMAKSKGRAITFNTAINDFGADVVRAVSVSTTEPEADSDFRVKDAQNMIRWQNRFYELVNSIQNKKISKETDLDKWLISRIMNSIEGVTKYLEILNTRGAAQICFYQMFNDFKWYLKRSAGISKATKNALNDWIKMISVFMPHLSEELWSKLGNKGFISIAQWPKVNKKKINKRIEEAEETIQKTIDDINQIKQIIKKKIKGIYIYVIPKELKIYKNAESFFSAQFGVKTQVFAANDKKKYDPQNKASKAKPSKPGIYLE